MLYNHRKIVLATYTSDLEEKNECLIQLFMLVEREIRISSDTNCKSIMSQQKLAKGDTTQTSSGLVTNYPAWRIDWIRRKNWHREELSIYLKSKISIEHIEYKVEIVVWNGHKNKGPRLHSRPTYASVNANGKLKMKYDNMYFFWYVK